MTKFGSKVKSKDQEARELTIKSFIHASCSPTTEAKRKKAIKKILRIDVDYTHQEFLQIWKGLFYCIWYAEMGKSCEDLIFEMAYSCRLRKERDYLVSGFELLAKEWMGIDFIRVDKYAHLVRHLINRSLRLALLDSDTRDYDMMGDILIVIESSVELVTHVTEIYLEELSNVMSRQVIWDNEDKADVYFNAIKPFVKIIATNEDPRVLETINESIFLEVKKNIMRHEDPEIRSQFYKSLVKECLNVGKSDQVRLKNRKIIFNIANQIKQLYES